MASQAQKMASNVNFGMLGKATELKSRLLFVLGALIVYRIGTFIPLPGVDAAGLNFEKGGGFLANLNGFTGGALGRMSIFALNVFPYITASIIMQLMTMVSKTMEAMKKEGDTGRRIINQYTKYLTIFIAGAQGIGLAIALEQQKGVILEPGFISRITIAITIIGSVMFLVWLGEQITSRGIGNGTSIIIAAGIISRMPTWIGQLFTSLNTGAINGGLFIAVAVGVAALTMIIVYVERAQRRITIQYPKRQVGANRITQGDVSHMPLKINTSGVIPAIFASALLGFPLMLTNFSAGSNSGWLQWISIYLGPHRPLFIVLYAFLIIFFSFFYTAVVFNPTETANNLKKNNGFIPGIRPGENTAKYLDYILTRLTVIGALYLTLVCVVPEIFYGQFQLGFYIGGTSLLIVVNVVMDTIMQIQTHLISYQYEGLIKKAQARGRKKR